MLRSDAVTVYYYTDTSTDHSIGRYHAIVPQLRRWEGATFPLSKTNRMLWLVIEGNSVPAAWQTRYLVVRNPHINQLYSWLLQNNQVVLAHRPTGDKYPFASRNMRQPDFAFDWPDATRAAGYRFVLLLDKRYEVTNIPLHFFTEEDLYNLNRSRGTLFGLMLGMMLFIMIFSLFLFFNMKEWLYICYGLFILFSLYYQFSDAGFSFMYLYPSQPFFSDFSRPVAATMSTVFYFLFLLVLLDVRKNLPRLFTPMAGLALLLAFFHFVTLPLLPGATRLRAILHTIWTLFELAIILCSLVLPVLALRKKIPFAGYALASVIILISCSVGYSQFTAGKLPDTFLTRNLYLLGIFSEIFLLSFMLSIRFRRYKEASEQLALQVQQQQEAIFKSVTDYQQRELERVSQMLHDTVGARLSAIRLNLERSASNGNDAPLLQQSIEQVGQLAGTVRDLSHALSPIMLEQMPLKKIVEEYVGFINHNGRLMVQLEWMGDADQLPFRYKLMTHTILQELLQNIIKHADATEAILQVICSAEIISIFAEDNGRGYQPDQTRRGLGLAQIEKLMQLTNGHYEIKNKPEGGTTVSVEYPVQNTV